MIIVVGTSKGGEGKTTIATNLAAMYAARDKDVYLVDADPQKSSYTWSSARENLQSQEGFEGLPLVPSGCLSGKIREKLKDLSTRYEVLIVDTQGRESAELVSALLIADVLLIPFSVGHLNIWALDDMAEIIEKARSVNEELKVKIVVNKGSTNFKVKDHEETAKILQDNESIKSIEPQLLDTVLHERRLYRLAAGYGLSVEELPDSKEFKASKEKAVKEMISLFEEVSENAQ